MTEPDTTLFDRIGGDALRRMLTDFYDRVFGDPMIGFLFVGKNKHRLIQKEWELAARVLGADVRYTGRPMGEAHAKSPILGGHFERRLKLLEETLADHAIDPEVRDSLVAHTRLLRPQVTADSGSGCDHDADQRRRR